MEKLIMMQKQLLFLHDELRKVKKFHKVSDLLKLKESSKNFKKFYISMNNSYKAINNGNIFNEIHYLNIVNLNMIEFFTNQISKQSIAQNLIHKTLKHEGNKLKEFRKQIEKKLHNLRLASVNKKNVNQSQELSLEMELTFKELSLSISSVRENIKKSFDEYLEGIYSFGDIKMQMMNIHALTEQNYKDCSPVIENRLDLLFNLKKYKKNHKNKDLYNADEDGDEDGCRENDVIEYIDPIMEKDNYVNMETKEDVYSNNQRRNVHLLYNNVINETLYTPIKYRRNLFPSSSKIAKSEFKINNEENYIPDELLLSNTDLKKNFSRSRIENSYLNTRGSTVTQNYAKYSKRHETEPC